MITATHVRDLTRPSTEVSLVSRQGLYRLSEPVPYGHDYGEDYETDQPEGHTEYVMISAATVMFSGPETFIFPTDKEGNVIDWGEMEGSYRGGLDHEEAIRQAGWVKG